MRAGAEDPLGVLLGQGVHAEGQGPGRVDDVVEDDDVLVGDLADDVQDLGHVRSGPSLVDDGQLGVQPLGEHPGPADAPGVRGNDGQVLELQRLDVVGQDGRGHEVVHGDREETLDLRRMEVHGQNAVGPRFFDQVRDEAGRDRDPGPVFPVLPGVGEVGDDGRDPARRRSLEGVDHDEQLHEVTVRVGRSRLDDEHILAADVLVDVEVDLAVAETVEDAPPEIDLQVVDDLPGQGRVR